MRGATVLLACVLMACTPADRGPRGDIERSLERAAAYLSATPLEHDENWFVRQGSRTLGSPFTEWAREGVQPAPRAQSVERVLRRTRDLEIPPAPRLARPEDVTPDPRPATTYDGPTRMRIIASLLQGAGRCKPDSPAATAELARVFGVEMHGYLLCHQAWALRVSTFRGCVSEADVQSDRERMATQMYAELLVDEAIDDLDLERMAILCFIGACHWLSEEQTAAVVAAQHEDGSWGSIPPEGVDGSRLRPQHSAALAFYALAQRRQELVRPPDSEGRTVE